MKVGDLVSVLQRQGDGWWKAENEAGETGVVPSTFLELYEEEDTVITRPRTNVGEHAPSAKERWKEIQEGIHTPTNVTDVLSALGAFPSGFRPSTLGGLLQKHSNYGLRSYVLPSLTDSKLAFQDLHWDVALNQIRSQITKVLRSCTIQSCTMIPPLGGDTEILSRYVRVCLFDGTNVLSNIHTVRCNAAATNPKLWKFAKKGRNIVLTIADSPSFTLRCDNPHANLGLLFELGVLYKRMQTGEKDDLSCGWAHLKLSDPQGKPIANKSYKLKLLGGTPYDKGIEVDSSILRRASTNRFQAMLAANREPKISIVLSTPVDVKKKYLNLLPESIVLLSSLCQIISLYRQLLADSLLRDRLSHRDADLIPAPVLAAFPDAVESPDLFDGFLTVWQERTKVLKAADKRDKENMKQMFTKCFMETIFPLLHSASLPPCEHGNLVVENQRKQKIFEHVSKHKPASALVEDKEFVLKSLLAPNVDHQPFDLSEVCFDLIKDYEK